VLRARSLSPGPLGQLAIDAADPLWNRLEPFSSSPLMIPSFRAESPRLLSPGHRPGFKADNADRALKGCDTSRLENGNIHRIPSWRDSDPRSLGWYRTPLGRWVSVTIPTQGEASAKHLEVAKYRS
jgi:hypothetical protein